MKKFFALIACLSAASVFGARQVAVPTLPESPFADTETSTNVAFSVGLERPTTFDLSLAFDGGASNALCVAFGRDANEDGVLDPGETETVYGWQEGRYFVEDVLGARRVFLDAGAGEGRRVFRVHVETDKAANVLRASAEDTLASVRLEIPESLRPCLCREGWDMVRLARRGLGALSETLSASVSHKGLVVVVQ